MKTRRFYLGLPGMDTQEYRETVIEALNVLPDLLQAIQDRISELEVQGDSHSIMAIRHALAELDATRQWLNRA